MSRALTRCTRGTVMIETLIAFVPTFTLFLGIVQYVLLAAAQLVVQHAAVAGVRSASVVLDDDPARYDSADRRSLVDGSSDGALVELAALTTALLSETPHAPSMPAEIARPPVRSGARMAPIRSAVYAKLAAIVPARAIAALHGEPGRSVLDGLGEEPALRLVQAPLYLPITTAITFPRAPGSTELIEDIVPAGSLLTLRVTHVATCPVPIVAALMCRKWRKVLGSNAELEQAPAASLQALPQLAELRVKVLQAEASMPLQSATYPYASEPPERAP